MVAASDLCCVDERKGSACNSIRNTKYTVTGNIMDNST